MMRSLWTAASGMISQQTNLDTISNNLANVNTVGYKKETIQFKSLMYQTLQGKTTDHEGNPKPVGAQVGLGVRTGAITTNFTQGALNESGGEFDYALEGRGFFMVQLQDGSIGYTRNGDFNMSLLSDKTLSLTDTNGNSVLDTNGKPIILPKGTKSNEVGVDLQGYLTVLDEKKNPQRTDIQIGLAYFPNPGGLVKGSDSCLKESPASGEPTIYSADQLDTKIVSGYLESSNVQAVDEMVNMIIAQRAYEMNSKAITASDEMLQQANNLRS